MSVRSRNIGDNYVIRNPYALDVAKGRGLMHNGIGDGSQLICIHYIYVLKYGIRFPYFHLNYLPGLLCYCSYAISLVNL